MRINVSIELRRPARRSVALVLAGLLLLTPAAVLASHQFPDVPTSHTFHGQISAIAKAGITAGFPDGGYHPSEPVTRQAMAAFMHRGFSRVGLSGRFDGQPITASVAVEAGRLESLPAVPVRRLTIEVPGANNNFGPNQLVQLHGQVSFQASMTPAQGCPCVFMASIRDVNNPSYAYQQEDTFESHVDPSNASRSYAYTFDVQALISAEPGPQTYELDVFLIYRADTTNAAVFPLTEYSSLSAMTFPFGPTGANTP